jgi:hypothetical protein
MKTIAADKITLIFECGENLPAAAERSGRLKNLLIQRFAECFNTSIHCS